MVAAKARQKANDKDGNYNTHRSSGTSASALLKSDKQTNS